MVPKESKKKVKHFSFKIAPFWFACFAQLDRNELGLGIGMDFTFSPHRSMQFRTATYKNHVESNHHTVRKKSWKNSFEHWVLGSGCELRESPTQNRHTHINPPLPHQISSPPGLCIEFEISRASGGGALYSGRAGCVGGRGES